MSWTVEKQHHFGRLVEGCRKETKKIMDRHFPAEQQSVGIWDALAEAYRAGAIDAIFKDE